MKNKYQKENFHSLQMTLLFDSIDDYFHFDSGGDWDNDYDFDLLFNAFYEWQTLMEHAKYMNNYDYNKAVYLMNAIPVLDNGFVFLKEDSAIGSPIGTLFYEYYSNANSLQTIIEKHADTTQCVVGNHATYIPFGATQEPNLWDYADAVNTLDFLLKLQ